MMQACRAVVLMSEGQTTPRAEWIGVEVGGPRGREGGDAEEGGGGVECICAQYWRR